MQESEIKGINSGKAVTLTTNNIILATEDPKNSTEREGMKKRIKTCYIPCTNSP